MAVGGEHEDVRVAGVGAAEMGAESYGSGAVGVVGVGGTFAYVETGYDEGFVDDGLDGGVVDEVLEHVAGAAPGGAEDEQDVFVLGGGGGAGLGHDGVGAGENGGHGVRLARDYGGGEKDREDEERVGAEDGLQDCAHERSFVGEVVMR